MVDIPAEFMAAIIANREDDAPRLICADWLEENGDSERGEFIRLQCEYVKLSDCKKENHTEWPHSLYGMPIIVDCSCRWCQLGNRSRRLLASHPEWASDVGKVFCGEDAKPRTNYGCDGCANIRWQFTRGFISDISLQWLAWQFRHPALLAVAPIANVELTTTPSIAGSLAEKIECLEALWHGIKFTINELDVRYRRNIQRFAVDPNSNINIGDFVSYNSDNRAVPADENSPILGIALSAPTQGGTIDVVLDGIW